MIKQLIIFILLVISISNLSSQTIYILTANNGLYKLEPDSNLSFITIIDNSQIEIPFADIAISPSNKIYGISQNKIFEINPQNGNTTLVTALPNFASGNSLTCSQNFELYTINTFSTDLVKYDLLNNTTEVVDQLGINTLGDLTFYKGNITFPSFDWDNNEYYLMAYNLSSNELSRIQCLGDSRYLGIANIFNSCETSVIIAGDLDGSLYELNIENQQITEYSINLTNNAIYGIASDNEYLSSECSFQFENMDCLLNNTQNQVNSTTKISIYPNPFTDKLKIETTELITKIEVFNINGEYIKQSYFLNEEIDLEELNSGVYILKIV